MLHRAVECCQDLFWSERFHAINAVLLTLQVPIDVAEAQTSNDAGENYGQVSYKAGQKWHILLIQEKFVIIIADTAAYFVGLNDLHRQAIAVD